MANRIAEYETEDRMLKIRPLIIKGNVHHIEVFSNTGKITLAPEHVSELIEVLQAIEGRYIRKTE